MPHPVRPHRLRPARARFGSLGLVALSLLTVGGLVGCNRTVQPPPALAPSYPDKGPKANVPAFMKGTIWEQTDLDNIDVYPVSNYGLVGRLRGTGDTTAPTAVRQAMYKEMVKRGFGSRLVPGYGSISPDQVLRDPNYAIVRVDGLIPPGARKDDWFTVQVSALPRNRTTSLGGGVLFETDLKRQGAERIGAGEPVQVFARCKGPIFVNPAYALEDVDDVIAEGNSAARASLRRGVVLENGRVMQDRPLFLVLRQPQRSLSRAIEYRINERFQAVADRNKGNGQPGLADAQDEGIVQVYVPRRYGGDWEHFAGVASHLYFNGSAQFAAKKAKELADVAVSEGAPLEDISYCWEGLGSPALPFIAPVLAHPSPEVAYAAARAAAYIGDPSGAAAETLMRMARTKDHPFQLSAVRVLGSLPPSAKLNTMLRELLDLDDTLVRVEAYKVLARNGDAAIYTQWVRRPGDADQKFALDIVPSRGSPLIYASRRGVQRIAVIGRSPALTLPTVFTAMGNRFSISSDRRNKHVTLFYRDDRLGREPVKMLSRPDVGELIARLGGVGAPEEDRFDFTYGEVVALVQALTSTRQMIAVRDDGRVATASFILQEAAGVEDEILSAPPLGGGEGRPQAEEPARVGQGEIEGPAPQATGTVDGATAVVRE